MKKAIAMGIIIFSFPIVFIMMICGGEETNAAQIPNASLNAEQAEFISQILPGALEGMKDGVFPSITLGQAILESGWGKSGLAVSGKNLFGIKADPSWKGETMELPTQEEVNGGMITITAKWRVYPSWNDSVRDHTKFLLENSTYRNNGVFDAKNYVEQAHALQKAGYATNSDYAEKLIEIINCYALNIYDFQGGEQSGNELIEKVISAGMSWVGKSPYVWGGGRTEEDVKAGRFDCSSFVHYCYASAGITLGDRSGVTTWTLVTLGQAVDKKDMKRGDIIFFNTTGEDTHVGIYLGNDKFIHDGTTEGVSIADLNNPYYQKAFNGKVRRIIN